MAGRPNKEGLDYFPINIDIGQDDKISYLEAKYGVVAFAVLIKLYIKIYREGYYCIFDSKQEFLFAKHNNIEVNVINNLINDYINEGLFHRNSYEKYKILTSNGIQKRYFEITKRRDKVKFIPEITIIDISEYNNLISVDINSINVNGLSTEIPKVKESKVKESKVKESKEEKRKEEKIPYEEILEDLNQKINSNYRSKSTKTRELIKAKWEEGFILEDFKTVHRKKVADWQTDNKMRPFLRPITLYGLKFESYLNQPEKLSISSVTAHNLLVMAEIEEEELEKERQRQEEVENESNTI